MRIWMDGGWGKLLWWLLCYVREEIRLIYFCDLYIYTYFTSLFLRCKTNEWREKKKIKLKIAIVFVYATLIYCTFVCTDSDMFKGEVHLYRGIFSLLN